MDIRPADSSDIPAILAIERLCFSHPYSGRQLEGGVTLIVQEGRDIIGYLNFHEAGVGGELELMRFAVHPQWQRRGVAQKLWEAVERQFPGRTVFLEVGRENIAAKNFYTKNGFCEIGLRKNYYADGSDAIVMKKHYCTR